MHAVSVGEVLAARPLVESLKARYPGLRLFVSTTTIAGQQMARGIQDADGVFYFPFDFAFVVRRVLDVRAAAAVRHGRKRDLAEPAARVPPAAGEDRRRQRPHLAGGRTRATGWPARSSAACWRSIDRFCMQSDESARRIIDIGADPARVSVTGSLKFDAAALPTASRAAATACCGSSACRPRARSSSRAARCEAKSLPVLRAFRRVKTTAPGALLLLAPRHAERFEEAMHLARGEGFADGAAIRLPIDVEPRADVIVVDTIGELAQLYQLATVAFVGGSLVETGGHNILEPAVFGRPIVFGPFMHNFAEIAARVPRARCRRAGAVGTRAGGGARRRC